MTENAPNKVRFTYWIEGDLLRVLDNLVSERKKTDRGWGLARQISTMLRAQLAHAKSPQKTPQGLLSDQLTNVNDDVTISEVTRDTVFQGLADEETAAVLKLIAVLKAGNPGLRSAVLGNLDLFGEFAHAIASRRVPAAEIPKHQLREVEDFLRKAEALERRKGETGGPGRRVESGT